MLISKAPFAFRWMLPVFGGVMLLWGLLFLLRFNLETSPGWQVMVHHLMLAFLVLGPLGVVFPGGFSRRGNFDWMTGALLLLVLVSVFTAGWFHGGAYTGFRDSGLFSLTVVAMSLFSLAHLFGFLSRAFLGVIWLCFRPRSVQEICQ